MNIYEKLQTCRVKLQEASLKKSGKNKHANYTYYELGDFLPTVNRLFAENKLFGYVSFTAEIATLTIIDTEKQEDQIIFTSPMESAKLPNCHPIQNLGAVETYSRRYLYTTALEIVEHDALDATTGAEKPSAGDKPSTATETNACACGASLTAGQVKVSTAKYGRPLCPACQTKEGA